MAKVYIDKTEMTNKDDFDSKVNVEQPLYRKITANQTWQDIMGVAGGNWRVTHSILTALRDENLAGNTGNTVGGNASGIVFGGGDTHTVLTARYDTPILRVASGNSTSPVWHEDVAWKSDISKLEARISALEKKIGGVLRRAKYLIHSILYRNEVLA